VLNVSNVGLVQ